MQMFISYGQKAGVWDHQAICVRVSPFQYENKLTYSYEIWYRCCAIFISCN